MAKRFRFRLETVRRLREQARDAQRRVVADAARAVKQVQDWITQCSRDLQNVSVQSRDARQMGLLDTVLLRQQQHYRGWLHRKTAEFRQELAAKQAGFDRERAKLAEAQRDLKVIEKLRERQWQRHLTEVAREEQLDNDEAAQQQQHRRGRERKREATV